MPTEGFPNPPFDPVPNNRVANLAADRYSDSALKAGASLVGPLGQRKHQ